jgi:uncharacterized protein
MEFRGADSAVIDLLRAKELQRLRRIRQTALAHLVYPAAEHSRLVHSLGVAYLGSRFVRQLEESSESYLTSALTPGPEARRDFALACLCHDLGHGPLSHVWENHVTRGFSLDRWQAALGLPTGEDFSGLSWHELVTQSLLHWEEGQLHNLLEGLEAGTSSRVRHLLMGDYHLPYLPLLIDGDIDCDRCDFVGRDARQTGVAYGRFDLAWMISTVKVGVAPDNTLVAGFDRKKATRVVEQFFVARRALYDTVYHHKTVRAAESMVGLFLNRLRHHVEEHGWIASDDDGLLRPYQRLLQEGVVGPEDILGLDDYTLWTLIGHVADSSAIHDRTLQTLATRLVNRDLFKEVPAPIDAIDRGLREGTLNADLTELIGTELGLDGEYLFAIDSARFAMFEQSESPQDRDRRAYFVDDAPNLPAARVVTDAEEIQRLSSRRELVRLFAPREVADRVVNHLGT